MKNRHYEDRIIQSVELLLIDKFPDILELKVEANDKGTISIQFLEGKYTKEEIELFLNETKAPPARFIEGIQHISFNI